MYKDITVYGVVNKAVILECGNTVPDMYIWSFTRPGTIAIKAVVFDMGQGLNIQKLAETLGQLTVISNSAALSIERLLLAAQGLFTCQAFYNRNGDISASYYYVYLTVQGKTDSSWEEVLERIVQHFVPSTCIQHTGAQADAEYL